jgi:MULE transposase domain
MSSNAVAGASTPYNLSYPALPGAVFSFVDEEAEESVSWFPHPDLPVGTRNRLVEAVGRLPRVWLMPPKDGELFDTAQAGQDRILGYSLAAGFQTVGGQHSSTVRKNIWCIHHGDKSRNDRGLSERVEKDPKTKKTVSTRKREDTGKWGKNCLWRCFLVPQEEYSDDGSYLTRWVLRYGKTQATALLTTAHSHEFALDPLVFPKHRAAQPHYQQALPQAVAMRSAHLSFRQAERVLWGQDLKIDRKTYYNLARQEAMPMTQDGLLSLVAVLEQGNWTYRSFWEYIRDPTGAVTSRVLKAVFFTNDELMKLARKFTPDWMIQVDGTFNTNRIRMPLIDCLGVSNTGKSFLFAFCFVTSESSDNWGFTLDSLAHTVYDGLPLPRVVIADQGMGLRACFSEIWPACTLQFCEWHAAENVRRRLATQRYKKDDRDVIMDLVWAYIWSETELELEKNRTAMKAAMKPADQEYIDRHWRPKERQVIRAFTALNANLNCFSSQRDEGQHPVVKTVLNPQLRLDEAVRRLAIEMTLAVERLFEAEQIDKLKNRRMLEANVWYQVRENVASWSLLTCEKQWSLLARFKLAGQPLDECHCTMNQRFGLPCLHDLEHAWDEGIPLPLSLIHSRWWYSAGIESRPDWKPTYGSSHRKVVSLDRVKHEIMGSTNQLLQFRESLTREQRDLLDFDYAQSTARVIQTAQTAQYWASVVPSNLPASIQSTWNRHAKSHDKVTKRMLTGAEAAVKDADKQEKEEARLQTIVKAAEDAIDDELLASDSASEASEVAEVVFSTRVSPPRRPSTPEAEVEVALRKRTHTLVMRTPDKPRPAPVAPATPSNLITSEAQDLHSVPLEAHELPASTAPARLDGRVRREGKNSEYVRAMAIERGRGRGGCGRGGRA